MSAAILSALIGIRFLNCLVLLTALIVIGISIKDGASYEAQVASVWKSSRIAAIVFYSLALGLGVLSILLMGLNFFVLQTSRILSLLINVFDLLMAIGLIGVSVPLIVADSAMPATVNNTAVRNTLFMVSGIMGLISVFFYLLDLFISRFYQFSIYEDSWYDDLWEYIYKYFYPVPPVYTVEKGDVY
ncbi:unnamed protein product [Brachionus calyciflorus]|uniref:Uncharacterized protein n=1 Tax=Brachionus calyciflorus TaxID=104777 RepID=A0A813XC55_9BILA|nr:unnamed protein product [Brachionus calyciflorus]